MKPFVFKLETLLKIRKRHEEEANIALSKARKKLFEAKTYLEKLTTQQQETVDAFKQKQENKELFALEFQSWYTFINFLQTQIKDQILIVEQITQEVATALKLLEQAMKNRKSVEKLKEKRYEQYRIDMLLEEQKILDEMAITRFKSTSKNF